MIGKLDLFRKDTRITQNSYWEETTGIRRENQSSKYIKIKREIKPVCVFSLDLFKFYKVNLS